MTEHPLLAGLDEVRRNWVWFLILGIAQVILGVAAVSLAWVATLVSVLIFGWFLIASGAFEAVAGFWARRWSGVFLHLLAGILSVVVGVLIIAHPVAAAAGLTLLLAVYFLVSGLFRVGAAAAVRLPHRGWEAVGGVITVVLGVLIWAEWPSTAFWVIGLFVGIDLIFRGWAWIMFASAVRQPAPAATWRVEGIDGRPSASTGGMPA